MEQATLFSNDGAEFEITPFQVTHLSEISKYFQELFENKEVESKHFTINFLDGKTLRQVLHFADRKVYPLFDSDQELFQFTSALKDLSIEFDQEEAKLLSGRSNLLSLKPENCLSYYRKEDSFYFYFELDDQSEFRLSFDLSLEPNVQLKGNFSLITSDFQENGFRFDNLKVQGWKSFYYCYQVLMVFYPYLIPEGRDLIHHLISEKMPRYYILSPRGEKLRQVHLFKNKLIFCKEDLWITDVSLWFLSSNLRQEEIEIFRLTYNWDLRSKPSCYLSLNSSSSSSFDKWINWGEKGEKYLETLVRFRGWKTIRKALENEMLIVDDLSYEKNQKLVLELDEIHNQV